MAKRITVPAREALRTLQRVILREPGLTVFDAETQDTSYGIVMMDGRPHIFDTHRKDGVHVSTIEILTELRRPVRISASALDRFLRRAEGLGLLPIPYSACFFNGNLHVYVFYGPVVGLDLSAVGPTVLEAEGILGQRSAAIWPNIPKEVLRAQTALLEGRREPRHHEDLEVLLKRYRVVQGMAEDRTQG